MLAKSIIVVDAVEKPENYIEHRTSEICGIWFVFQSSKDPDIARFGVLLT